MEEVTVKNEPTEPAQKPTEPTFSLPPEVPVLEEVEGIRFDFDNGLRVKFPDSGEYRCVFKDLDTDCLLYSMDVKPGCTVESVKKFHIRFGLEIYRKDDLRKPMFKHDLDLVRKEVLIQLPVGALGDTIAWFSFVERFQKKHNCKLSCSMAPEIAALFRAQYPEITFITKDEAAKRKPYATDNLGLFFISLMTSGRSACIGLQGISSASTTSPTSRPASISRRNGESGRNTP